MSGYSAAWSSAFDWGSKGREFESLYPDHFFCKKMVNEDASLHFSARSATSLKRRSLFFTSSPNSRSLACEVVSFRYCSITLVKRSAVAVHEVAACGGLMCFCFTALRLNGSKPPWFQMKPYMLHSLDRWSIVSLKLHNMKHLHYIPLWSTSLTLRMTCHP